MGADVVWADTLSLLVGIVRGNVLTGPQIATSPDGTTWTTRGNPFINGGGTSIAWSSFQGLLVAGGDAGISGTYRVATSADGITWTGHASPFDGDPDGLVSGIAYSPTLDLWVAVGADSGGAAVIATAPDGITWTTQTNPFAELSDVVWFPSIAAFVACGNTDDGRAFATSVDGSTWVTISTDLDGLRGYGAVDTGAALAVCGGTDGATQIVASTDGGSTWGSDTDPTPFPHVCLGLAYSSDLDLAVACGGTISSGEMIASGLPTPAPPTPPPPVSMDPGRRVGIAFNDGPLEPNPTFTWLDDDTVFPPQFVSGYDTKNGRQGLISQTETGTATVYVNDHELGLFDDRNVDSPYYGLLDGKQITLQLWDPVALAWEEQFGGWIENYTYDIDGSAIANPWADPADRQPINASIQIECVDMFDQLAGFGLTPGLAGDRPPSGMQDGVYYPESTNAGRMIEVLTDVLGVDFVTARTDIFEGNAHSIATKYDPDESALAAIRDAADTELPFIGNIYCDRHRGRFCFRGRYSRFDPDGVAGEPLSTWDFTRWAVGDGAAIAANPARAQMRVLSFERSRPNVINAALCYPQGIAAADMPNQVYTSPSSILANGKHDAPPMSDLLVADIDHTGTPSPGFGKHECFRFAKLLVKNQAEPRESITALQVKAIHPADPRAEVTWAVITRSDIGHIVNVAVGYPGGTGWTGDSPIDDYYIEGRSLRVRPLNPEHDYVEYTVNVSPAVWSMDTHGVFPPFTGDPPLRAAFTRAETDPGVVVFTDESTPGPSGPITAWAWDFGDGGTDTTENPTYTYAANGTYDVTLLVTGTGGDGTDIETRTVKITDIP